MDHKLASICPASRGNATPRGNQWRRFWWIY
jgi:hypothetical protein